MFKVNISRMADHTFILDLEGPLTATTSVAFQKILLPIMSKRPKAVSVNLSNVKSIDEAGIAMVMNGLLGAPNHGTYFYVVGLPKKVKDYYQVCTRVMGHPFSSRTTH